MQSFTHASRSTAYALAAIALWALLASLGLALRHVPPFLLTGIALLVGSSLAWPFVLRQPGLWRVSSKALGLGVYGLFGFHFLLFIALRHAPPVQANLVNYLWPLLMVVLAPLFLPNTHLTAIHLIAVCVGFTGAAAAIMGSSGTERALFNGLPWGYLPAAGSAFIWASYSLTCKRWALAGQAFPSAAVGLFALVSGLLALLCHWTLEAPTPLSAQDWGLLLLMGLGPLGAAFFLWDAALKHGDAQRIGIWSYLTPLLSTALLMLVSGQPLTWAIAGAAALIVGAAVLATRA